MSKRPLDYGKLKLSDLADVNISVTLPDSQADFDVISSETTYKYKVPESQFTPDQNVQPPIPNIRDSHGGIVVSVDNIDQGEVDVLTNDRRRVTVNINRHGADRNLKVGDPISIQQPTVDGPWLGVGDLGRTSHEAVRLKFTTENLADPQPKFVFNGTPVGEAYARTLESGEWDRFWEIQNGNQIEITKTGLYYIFFSYTVQGDELDFFGPVEEVRLAAVGGDGGDETRAASFRYNVIDPKLGVIIQQNVAPAFRITDRGPLRGATIGTYSRGRLLQAFEQIRGTKCED